MKLLCFSPKYEGEMISVAWINIRRHRDSVIHDSGTNVNGFSISVYLPIPIKQTFDDFYADRIRTAWRFPVVGIKARRCRGVGKMGWRFFCYMLEICK